MTPERLETIKSLIGVRTFHHQDWEIVVRECVEEIERLQRESKKQESFWMQLTAEQQAELASTRSQLKATELDVHEAKVEVCKLEDQLASTRAELEMLKEGYKNRGELMKECCEADRLIEVEKLRVENTRLTAELAQTKLQISGKMITTTLADDSLRERIKELRRELSRMRQALQAIAKTSRPDAGVIAIARAALGTVSREVDRTPSE